VFIARRGRRSPHGNDAPRISDLIMDIIDSTGPPAFTRPDTPFSRFNEQQAAVLPASEGRAVTHTLFRKLTRHNFKGIVHAKIKMMSYPHCRSKPVTRYCGNTWWRLIFSKVVFIFLCSNKELLSLRLNHLSHMFLLLLNRLKVVVSQLSMESSYLRFH